MTTNPALRSTLLAFRSMVRARGPRECLEVAAVKPNSIQLWCDNCYGVSLPDICRDYEFRMRLPRLAARAALRWWRWAERESTFREWCEQYEAIGGTLPDYWIL